MNQVMISEYIVNLVDLLEKNDLKSLLIEELNKNINIPIINEKTEGKILEEIYSVILKVLQAKIKELE